jgi:hypothetical protein
LGSGEDLLTSGHQAELLGAMLGGAAIAEGRVRVSGGCRRSGAEAGMKGESREARFINCAGPDTVLALIVRSQGFC